MRKEKEIIEYLDEAFDKVWLMRTTPCGNPDIEEERIKNVERILNQYSDIPEEGYSEWDDLKISDNDFKIIDKIIDRFLDSESDIDFIEDYIDTL